jgi:hypothetical protein
VEYELQLDGEPLGLFDVDRSGRQLGSWVGFGAWKPMPALHPKLTAAQLAKVDADDDSGSDEPVLHRKHHAGDAPAAGSGSGAGSSTGSDSGIQAPSDQAPSDRAPSDPDRPVLHKAPSAGGTDASSGSANGPVLHKKDSSSDTDSASSDTQPPSDPDRPVLHKPKPAAPAPQVADDDDAPSGETDPDRPRLKRGKSTSDAIAVAPSLVGLPADLEQTVAVSDARNHPAHPWDYHWSNPDDEAKMKSAMEAMARTALGLDPPPAKPAPKRAATTARKRTRPVPPPTPAPLVDEHFRVFELAYGSGATMVLSAHSSGAAAQQKFVTLIAQPDLYGNVLLLKKNVTDGAHLDEQPRMRLVDAVDAMADNRGELLFELRGATQRQFALYRVLRGQAEQLFVTGSGQFAADATQP